MKRFEADLSTSASPGQVLSALTDFSDARPEVWPALSERLYEVHEVHPTSAVVTEGSTAPFKIWAKEAYDWSEPGTVTWRVVESNVFTPGSYVSVRAEPDGDGSRVHMTWEREGQGFKGRLLVAMVAASKGKPIVSATKKVLDGLASS